MKEGGRERKRKRKEREREKGRTVIYTYLQKLYVEIPYIIYKLLDISKTQEHFLSSQVPNHPTPPLSHHTHLQ